MGRWENKTKGKSFDPPSWICHYFKECPKPLYCHHGELHYCQEGIERCYDYGPGGIMAYCERKGG